MLIVLILLVDSHYVQLFRRKIITGIHLSGQLSQSTFSFWLCDHPKMDPPALMGPLLH